MHSEPQIELKIAQAASQRQWQVFGLVMLALAVVLAVFWPTLRGMVEIWNRSETFTHGWLVIPTFVWFTWERRQKLATIPLRPFWPGLVAVAGGGLGWLAANAAGVAVVEQLAVIGLISACIVTVFGWRVGWELAFPLAFLFFAVPMGEALIPPMMEMTADFTVAALEGDRHSRLPRGPVLRHSLGKLVDRRGLQRTALPDRVGHRRLRLRVPVLPLDLAARWPSSALRSSCRSSPTGFVPTSS